MVDTVAQLANRIVYKTKWYMYNLLIEIDLWKCLQLISEDKSRKFKVCPYTVASEMVLLFTSDWMLL